MNLAALSLPQRTALARIRANGSARFDGRQSRTLDVLASVGLIEIEWHAEQRGPRGPAIHIGRAIAAQGD